MSKAVVISFYTPEWEYRSRAQQLMRDCDALELPHDIRARESQGNWNRNTAMKPEFIREMLDEHKHVIWLDCDGTLLAAPNLCMYQPDNVAITAVPHHTMSRHPTTPRDWHTGLLSIRRSSESFSLIEAWASECTELQITDELGFHHVCRKTPGIVEALPANYLRIIHRARIPADTVYGLGLSESPDKLAMKKRQRAKPCAR